MMKTRHTHNAQRGAALIFALMMLSIFAVLGTAYLRYMSIAAESAGIVVNEARARQLAEAGIYAAIGDLARAREAEQLAQVMGTKQLSLPTYEGTWDGEAVRLLSRDDRSATAAYTVTDENAKININFAPPSVLQTALEVDGATAREIGAAIREEKLLHPADLLARGLVDQESYAAIDFDSLTTYTVLEGEPAVDYINLNSVSPKVLAAITDVPTEKAERADMLSLRPFDSLDAVEAAVEKDASTFNIRPDAATPDTMPEALALRSRCFHVRSEGAIARLGRDGAPYQRTLAEIDAVILFDSEGNGYKIVHWGAQRAE